MSVWAIVPVKPFNRAKSRLAGALSPEQREQLAARLLTRTVKLLVSQAQMGGVLVISRDTKALSLVRDLGAQTIQESGAPELNRALYRATQAVRAFGAEAVLVVPADLPLLAVEDIEAVVNRGHYHSVVIAPDRHQHGTNLLLVRPPGLIPYSFGEDSFATHQRLAREAGAEVLIYRSACTALDIDTPDDLVAYSELAKQLEEPILDNAGLGEWLLARELS